MGGLVTDDAGKSKGGRPRVEVPGVRVSTYIRAPDYDRLLALAQQHEKSLSGVVRELLHLKLTR